MFDISNEGIIQAQDYLVDTIGLGSESVDRMSATAVVHLANFYVDKRDYLNGIQSRHIRF